MKKSTKKPNRIRKRVHTTIDPALYEYAEQHNLSFSEVLEDGIEKIKNKDIPERIRTIDNELSEIDERKEILLSERTHLVKIAEEANILLPSNEMRLNDIKKRAENIYFRDGHLYMYNIGVWANQLDMYPQELKMALIDHIKSIYNDEEVKIV